MTASKAPPIMGAVKTSYLFALLAVIAGTAGGILLERFILRRLRAVAERTRWQGDEVVISSLRGVTTLWLTLLGVYVALTLVQMPPRVYGLALKALLVLAVLSATLFLSRLAAGFLDLHLRSFRDVIPPTSLLKNLSRLAIFTLGGLILLQTLGISITPALTALGIGGLAVALALQEPLANLFSGLHILLSKQIRPGDYVKLETGEEGYVVDISWRNTTIRQLPNNVVVVPNSKLASIIVTNYYLPQQEMSVLVQVGVSYDSDLEKVERVTIEVAKEVLREVPGGVPEFEPFIRYHTFDDFSINFTVILRAREFVDQYLLKHEFIKRLHKRYQQEGIEIPFPIRTIYMRNQG